MIAVETSFYPEWRYERVPVPGTYISIRGGNERSRPTYWKQNLILDQIGFRRKMAQMGAQLERPEPRGGEDKGEPII